MLLPRLNLLSSLALGLVTGFHNAQAAPTFDYVVVGGGTCGLVIANRLTEDPAITVAVIEAGGSVFDNPNVTATDRYGAALGTNVDWSYESVPQIYTGNTTKAYSAGKAIGGTSAINGMTYIRAEDDQIDAFQQLGNRGWTWKELFPYYKKSENLYPPTAKQKAEGASYNPDYHGRTGPLDVGWNPDLPPKSIQDSVENTWSKLGFPPNPDMGGGKLRGYGVWPQTLNAATGIREDAARAYYWPFSHRKNLVMFANTTAVKLEWTRTGNGTVKAVARGVKVAAENGTEFLLSARKEVIISAGSLRSPGLLEVSGVGNPHILAKHGVPVVVNLPGVGENLQDQPNNNIQRNVSRNATGYPTYVTFATASDLFGGNVSSVAEMVRGSIPDYARKITSAAEKGATTVKIQERLLTQQFDLIFKSQIPVAEILTAPSGTKAVAVFWVLLPFSRGSVHMSSSNAFAPPLINTNFFMLDWDSIAQVAAAKLARKVLGTPPLATRNSVETLPGLAEVPSDAGDATWANWLKQSYVTNCHPVGTLAMMDRELGGVVSPELQVYGTSNVRVVDASVLPFQVDGHLTSTLYAIAERAADLIKAHQRSCAVQQ